MTFAPPTASGAATRRLGVANGLLWIVAAIVLVVVGATTAYSFVVSPYVGGGLGGVDRYPWEAENPLEAEEAQPGVWSAAASAAIRIPASRFEQPLRASIVGGADNVDLYLADPALAATEPNARPRYYSYLYGDRTELLVPSGADLELWVIAGGAWQLRLEPVDVIMIDDDYDGTGNATVMYTGDAASARFVHVGNGIFFVGIYTAYDRDTGAIIESGAVNQRVSWDPGSWVVFEIESDTDRGAWSIDIEQLAQPDPTSTTEPDE